MHINSGYSSLGMYNAEARNRMLYLNPGTNYTPWLFMDGTSSGSSYGGWQNLILGRATISTPISARMWGNYNPATRSGIINVRFFSDSAASLDGNVLFIITEDSIVRSAPNGDQMHNHVARDYMPDHIGTSVNLREHDSITISYPYTINSGWVANRCEIIAFIQDQNLAGSTREVWQGAKVILSELPVSGVEEPNHVRFDKYPVSVSPNPCLNRAQFSFSLPAGNGYQINFYDASGRNVQDFHGTASGLAQTVTCDLSKSLISGVYFYRFESAGAHTTGKIIVK